MPKYNKSTDSNESKESNEGNGGNKRIFSFVAVIAFAANPLYAAPVEQTVAKVNGEVILLSEYQRAMDARLELYRKNAPGLLKQKERLQELREKVLQDMVEERLLIQEAESRKVRVYDREMDGKVTEFKAEFQKAEGRADREATFQEWLKKQGYTEAEFRDWIKKRLLIQKLVDQEIRPQVKPPKEEEVQAYFKRVGVLVQGDTTTLAGLSDEEAQALVELAQKVKEETAEKVWVRHLLIGVGKDADMLEKEKARKRIQELKKDLEKGADFAELATKYSQDPGSARRGGDLGPMVRGMSPPDFEKAAFALPLGELSDVIETSHGYHLLRVEGRFIARSVRLEEFKEDTVGIMLDLQLRQKLEDFVKKLKTKASIDTYLPKEN